MAPTALTHLAVMGGTFDPIHFGHLIIAEQVRETLELDAVLFIPCGQPPHKPGRRLSPAGDRHAMTVLATADNDRFRVSRVEIDRPGLSYAIDTLRELKAAHGSEAEFTFVVGADQALELATWRQAAELLWESHFVTVPRPGYDLGLLAERLGPLAERVQVLPLPELAISASDIRGRAARGLSIRYLTPEPVREYILSRRLYALEAAEGRSQERTSQS